MAKLVADTSALLSLGMVSGCDPDPAALCLSTYHVVLPDTVLRELGGIGSYDDEYGQAAREIKPKLSEVPRKSVEPVNETPLHDGETAAVSVANEVDAKIFLTDAFDRLGILSAALDHTHLVTTPTLLVAFAQTSQLSSTEVMIQLENISAGRNWNVEAFIQRLRTLLERNMAPTD